VLDRLAQSHGLPKVITCDNGPEFASVATRKWQQHHETRQNFIEPGKPMQNAFVERFNSRMQDDLLQQVFLLTVLHRRPS